MVGVIYRPSDDQARRPSPLELAPFKRQSLTEWNLGTVVLRIAHEGEHVGFSVIHEGGPAGSSLGGNPDKFSDEACVAEIARLHFPDDGALLNNENAL